MAALRRLGSPQNAAYVCAEAVAEEDMQRGRGGMGSHKHGVCGHATQSPRLRLSKKLAAERGDYDTTPPRRRTRLEFETVQEALKGERKPR
ncbi:MAG: hypothetical protein WBX30_02595 [Stellaceae bacterium]